MWAATRSGPVRRTKEVGSRRRVERRMLGVILQVLMASPRPRRPMDPSCRNPGESRRGRERRMNGPIIPRLMRSASPRRTTEPSSPRRGKRPRLGPLTGSLIQSARLRMTSPSCGPAVGSPMFGRHRHGGSPRDGLNPPQSGRSWLTRAAGIPRHGRHRREGLGGILRSPLLRQHVDGELHGLILEACCDSCSLRRGASVATMPW
mmetsp:Transcript_9186/g.24071  ORF Transcript_9186/g.24071 Transcript_9186/m.24071 type:complete len:205 (-) Transcript_9186:72-686(-)